MTDALIIQILSMMFIAISLGIFVNPAFYKKILEDVTENESTAYLGAMISFVIGFLLTSLRSTPDPTTERLSVITIIGWISLIKGLLMIGFPRPCLKIVRFFSKRRGFLIFGGTVALFVGMIFMYMGIQLL